MPLNQLPANAFRLIWCTLKLKLDVAAGRRFDGKHISTVLRHRK
jgi:hypothetical protein